MARAFKDGHDLTQRPAEPRELADDQAVTAVQDARQPWRRDRTVSRRAARASGRGLRSKALPGACLRRRGLVRVPQRTSRRNRRRRGRRLTSPPAPPRTKEAPHVTTSGGRARTWSLRRGGWGRRTALTRRSPFPPRGQFVRLLLPVRVRVAGGGGWLPSTSTSFLLVASPPAGRMAPARARTPVVKPRPGTVYLGRPRVMTKRWAGVTARPRGDARSMAEPDPGCRAIRMTPRYPCLANALLEPASLSLKDGHVGKSLKKPTVPMPRNGQLLSDIASRTRR